LFITLLFGFNFLWAQSKKELDLRIDTLQTELSMENLKVQNLTLQLQKLSLQLSQMNKEVSLLVSKVTKQDSIKNQLLNEIRNLNNSEQPNQDSLFQSITKSTPSTKQKEDEPLNPTIHKTPYIQELIDNTPDGSTITFEDAIYIQDKAINIDGRINLTLNFSKTAMIVNTNLDDEVVIIKNSNKIVINNGLFKHLKTQVKDPEFEMACTGMVFEISDSYDITISGCNINGCGTIGVSGYGSSNVTIENCNIHDNSYAGVNFYYDDANIIVRNCNFFNNGGTGVNNIFPVGFPDQNEATFENNQSIINCWLNYTPDEKKKMEICTKNIFEYMKKQGL
jgi:parallel beta-helix repeat protein